MMRQDPWLLQYGTKPDYLSPIYKLSVPMLFERQDLIVYPDGSRKVRRSKVGRIYVIASIIKNDSRKRYNPHVIIESACPHNEPCRFDCYNVDSDAPIVERSEAIFLLFRELGYCLFDWDEDALEYWLESRDALSDKRARNESHAHYCPDCREDKPCVKTGCLLNPDFMRPRGYPLYCGCIER
jgi:hypothetical protein